MPGSNRGPRNRLESKSNWEVHAIPFGKQNGRFRSGANEESGFQGIIQELLRTERLEPVELIDASLPGRRGVESQPLVFDWTPPEEGTYAAIARYSSGGIKIYLPVALEKRSGARSSSQVLRFEISPPVFGLGTPNRRGVISQIIRVIVVKVVGRLVGKVTDWALPKLSLAWEERAWAKKNRPLGLNRVTVSGGKVLLSSPEDLTKSLYPKQPALLFIHGTLSHFEGCFGSLSSTKGPDGQTLFESLGKLYGDQIYAFNHLTIGKDPVQNAIELLESLPDACGTTFDVITHSRGGLVIGACTSGLKDVQPLEHRLKIDKVVLVASPNHGTPLALPDRWDHFTTLIANLIEVFPTNPFTLGVEFIAEAIGWLAQKAGGVIPGLAAMNPSGPFISTMTQRRPSIGSWSALVANFEPQEVLSARLLDIAADGFFQTANDLVVPTENGWHLGDPRLALVPANRIGCFGPGGNLISAKPGVVHHCSFFDQSESVSFITSTLSGNSSGAIPIDPQTELPTKNTARRTVNLSEQPDVLLNADPHRGSSIHQSSKTMAPSIHEGRNHRGLRRDSGADVLNLFILNPTSAISSSAGSSSLKGIVSISKRTATHRKPEQHHERHQSLMIASFRNARVFEPFNTRSGQAGQNWHQLISMQRRIRGYVDGDVKHHLLPNDKELREFGGLLFSTLFPGEIRRLYDAARSESYVNRLSVCLTSTIPWVADIPWEFAFDTSRKMFLAMEEINFLRNIPTAVPADSLPSRLLPMRILIVAAQPIGAGQLSTEEEERVIRTDFEPLTSVGLVEIEVLPRATPAALHQLLSRVEIEERPFDILHFIGHGEFNAQSNEGFLVFEQPNGSYCRLSAEHFRQIVAHRGIRLVFLNACETGVGYRGVDQFDYAQGMAPTLVAGGIPAVVANQFKVLDPSATAFAQQFYWSLATGKSIGDAAREARVSVNYSITGEAIDWAVPILFAQNPADRLIDPMALPPSTGYGKPTVLENTSIQRSLRRGSSNLLKRVGLWDVNRINPSLNIVLQRLNSIQDTFEFEVVDLIAPIGTWRRTRKADGSVTVLDAQEIETKLKDTPSSLGIQHLVCLTNFPLGDDEHSDLVSHVSEDGRISIISTDGLLGQLDPPQYSLERLLTNLLLYNLSQLDCHKRPPKTCPSFFNDSRDIKFLAGKLTYCPACRRKLSPTIEKAILRLVDAFP